MIDQNDRHSIEDLPLPGDGTTVAQAAAPSVVGRPGEPVAITAGASVVDPVSNDVQPHRQTVGAATPDVARLFSALARMALPSPVPPPGEDTQSGAPADRIGDRSKDLSGQHRLQAAVAAIVRLAATVPGEVTSTHVTLDWAHPASTRRHEQLTAASDLAAADFAAAERETSQGPSWQARSCRQAVFVADALCDPRWPALSGRLAITPAVHPRRAGQPRPAHDPDPAAGTRIHPVRTVFALPLLDADMHPVGALTFTKIRPGPFDPGWAACATAFAEAAAGILLGQLDTEAQRERAVQLATALVSRAVIDQAKGILMERRGCDGPAAFALLAQASQRANIKLREVARLVVEDAHREPGGSQPSRPPGPQPSTGRGS